MFFLFTKIDSISTTELENKLKEKSLVFTEKELNEAIKDIYPDYSLIRRYLVDYKFLERDNYGKMYKIVGEEDE